jgi:hypothetical protein
MRRNLAIVGFMVGAVVAYATGGLGTLFLQLGTALNRVMLTQMGTRLLVLDLQSKFLLSALLFGLLGILIGYTIGTALDSEA